MKECSHEGHKLGSAMSHLKKLHGEHGTAAAAGNKAVGGAKQPMKAIQRMGRAGHKSA